MEPTITMSLKDYEDFIKLKTLLEANQRVVVYTNYYTDPDKTYILKLDEDEALKSIMQINEDLRRQVKLLTNKIVDFKQWVLDEDYTIFFTQKKDERVYNFFKST